jgi:thioredoxin reductase/SAM-dependent methyltransferase
MNGNASMEAERRYDVIVIGGGAAGLSGALTLARARRSVLVIDGGEPRNAPAAGVHTYLSREGMPPAQLLAAGRAEVACYGGEIVPGRAVAAERIADGGLRVVTDDGATALADRLLVATGVADELPQVPGLAEQWGRGVVSCPYCHGWEVRDRAIGVLATGPLAVHQALLWRQWSENVTLFVHTGPAPDKEQYEQLAARGIAIVMGEVSALESAPVAESAAEAGADTGAEGERLAGVRLSDGSLVPCEALTVTPRFAPHGDSILGRLGLEPVEESWEGHVVGYRYTADASGATEVPGVWLAGNVTTMPQQVIGAADAGVRAGAAINADLLAAENRRAVEAHRRSHTHGKAGGAPEGMTWDEWYGEREQVWSGRPNVVLVREVEGARPGRALDLGCGEGADAIWLAGQGWHVTAADVSRVALDRAAEHAATAGVADRIDWQQHDLGDSFPDGTFDLVSAQFLHAHGDLPREEILRKAADAVAPGGTLLIEGHTAFPSWEHDHADAADTHLPTADEVIASLRLPDGEWKVLISEEHERTQTRPDGSTGNRTDCTVKLLRKAN